MRTGSIAVIGSLLLLVAQAGFAQQSIDQASVSGRVTDQSGAVVPGAQVTARHTDTNLTASTTSDREGRFRFPYLKVGPYVVTATLSGFTDATRSLTLGVGGAYELPLILSVGAIDANVTVTGGAPVLESARSQIAGTVPQAEARALPLNGRNFLELALLVPGVSITNISSTQLFPETSAVAGISLSVGSQRNLSNNFVVDGLSANDDAAGLSGITYSVDAVDQFQVVTSGAQAELGRALGGYVNIVTKSGTNTWHGTAYDFIRDDNLNAENVLSGTKLPMHQSQYGGSLGGPILENRTFYFGNFEQRRLDQTGLATISDANAAIVNAHLAAVGYGGPKVETGEYKNPVNTTNVLAKIDHQINGRSQLGIRYSLYDASSHNSRGAGGLSAPSASSALDNLDQAIAVSHTTVLSARTVLETRAQFASSDLKAPPTDPVGPAVNIAGVGSFGRLSNSPTGRLTHMVQVVSSLSHQSGAHAFRVGADWLYNDVRIEFPRAVGGAYTFSSLANFLAGTYNNSGFSQTFGATSVSQTNPNVGVYAQDEWKATPDVTVNLGLRYDLQVLETIDTDTNNLSPRLGVAWTPTESRRTVVRASAGLFFDRVPLRALANALLSAGNTTDLANLRQTGISLSPTQAGAPVFPDVLAAPVPSVTLPSLSTMDRNIQNAYSRQASVEIEQQLGDRTTASVGYSYLRGANILMSINQNVPTCVASGGNNGCRPNPAYANNSRYSSAGSSNYHGLHVSLTGRPTDWGQFRVSYTLSKSMNDVGEFFFSGPIDPTDVSKDWGRSDDDQRHRVVVDGEVTAYGFQVSGMLQAYSAPPFNVTSGVTTIQGTSGRPIVDGAFIPRNSGEGTPFVTLGARVGRWLPLAGRARLQVLVEGFNLTNHSNVVSRNTNFGSGAYPTNPSSSFGQVTAVGDPRAGQVGVRVSF